MLLDDFSERRYRRAMFIYHSEFIGTVTRFGDVMPVIIPVMSGREWAGQPVQFNSYPIPHTVFVCSGLKVITEFGGFGFPGIVDLTFKTIYSKLTFIRVDLP